MKHLSMTCGLVGGLIVISACLYQPYNAPLFSKAEDLEITVKESTNQEVENSDKAIVTSPESSETVTFPTTKLEPITQDVQAALLISAETPADTKAEDNTASDVLSESSQLLKPAFNLSINYAALREKAAAGLDPENKMINIPAKRISQAAVSISQEAGAPDSSMVHLKQVNTNIAAQEEASKQELLNETDIAAEKHEAEENADIKTSDVKQSREVLNTTEVKSTTVLSAEKEVKAEKKTEEKHKSGFIVSYAVNGQQEAGADNYSYDMLYEKADQLQEFAKKNGFSTKYAFIVNAGMKSGKKRFFVMDLTTMTIVKVGLVAHGHGDSQFTFDKKYSNESGSNCTALGIYKVGKFYNGSYGPSYKLHGLEESNSNAYKRSIVLHATKSVPNVESEYPIWQSEGCPALSPQFLNEIRPMIDGSSKPVLLYIFDGSVETQSL